MLPRDWLLRYIAADPERAVDPLRLQKGLFLLAMRGVIPPDEAYRFEPYAYGPMSRALYGDLRVLVGLGVVEEVDAVGARWRAVRVTSAGLDAARQRPAGDTGVAELRRELDELGFADLLERVYAAHPEFAVNSVFRRRRR